MNEGSQDPPVVPPAPLSAPELKRFLLIALAIAALYGRVAWFDFVTYDDYDLIYQNTDFLSNLSNVTTAFTTQVFANHHAESVYYRPILMVSFILDYHLWDLNPIGYHIMNLVLHIVATLAVFLLIEKLAGSIWAATVGGFLFALHPVQTESVAWIAGRNDLLLGLFVVLMIYFYISSHDRSGRPERSFIVSVLFFALALFTKEAAAFYLLLVPLYDICLNRATVRTMLSRRILLRYACLAAILALYLTVRFGIFGEMIGAEKLYGSSPILRRLQEVPAIVAEYCLLLIVPIRLSIAHPLNQLLWLRSPWSWLAVGVLIGLAVVIWWSWRRDRIACFGLLWFAVGLLPTLDIIPVAVPILEHRLYLPMAGLALTVARAGFLAFGPASRRPGLKVVPVAAIALFSMLSVVRLPVWKDSETLWLDTISKAPSYSRSYFNLAGYYFNLQRYDDAIGLLKKYVELKPTEFLGYSKLRESYFLAGQYGEAARVCREMIARAPRDPRRYIEAAELFENLRMRDSAVAVCRSGLEVDSSLYQLHEHLGSIYAAEDSLDQAQHELQRAISLNPRYSPAHFGLGNVFAHRHENGAAIRSIEEGIQYGNPPVEVLQLLESLYAGSGQGEKARELHERYIF